MKIQFASDLHLEFRDNWRYLRDNGPMDVKGDILVLAGDTGYLGDDMYSVHPFWNWASENFEQVLVALGNHEFYKYYDLKTMQDGLVGEIRPNVHYYYNKVVTIQDVDFIISTLWAHIDVDNAFVTERGVADFYRIVYGENLLTYSDFNNEHQRCLDFIKKSVSASQAKHKVVVTHHVPSYQLVAPEFRGSRINGASPSSWPTTSPPAASTTGSTVTPTATSTKPSAQPAASATNSVTSPTTNTIPSIKGK